MAAPGYENAPVQDVTNLEETKLYTPTKGIDKKAIYIVNEGVSPLEYKVYTSPSGIRTTDLKYPERVKYTTSEVAKEWADIQSGTLAAGASLHINMDLVTAHYIKLTSYIPGGYAYVGNAGQIRAWFMGIDAR